MIAVAFVVLVFGALVAVIWGQKAAQGCFINILKGFGGLVIIGLTAVIPQLMIPLLVMYGVYLIGAYVAQANRAKSEEDDKNKLIARLNVAKAFLDDAMLPIGQSQLQASHSGSCQETVPQQLCLELILTLNSGRLMSEMRVALDT
jgi:uncharacterized membrane protein